MCGIAGIVDHSHSLDINDAFLRAMADPLRYRGPDQEGYFVHQTASCQVGLAHKRLSIIDLSENGLQPMHSADGQITIVFNGEIYNYRELKEKLYTQGIRFRTSSDTEVIIAAYQAWGIDATLDSLEGMFAFALFDHRIAVLIIARDRFGEKPLYYMQQGRMLAFSSDIRSFDIIPGPRTVDYEALGYYLSEMCTPIDRSIWQQIHKLAPAHYATFTAAGLQLKNYWQPDYRNKISLRLEEAVDRSEQLLVASIKQRLVADTPVGCFLSGGIDSSLVSLFAAQNYHQRIHTFSVGFEYEAYNELPYARQVADIIDSDHHEIIINPNDLHIADALLAEYGEPFADSSQIPTYYVSKFASSMVKVTLGGDGGDEIFAGYKTYNQGLRMQQWYRHRYLHPLMRAASALGSPKASYLAGIMSSDTATLASALYRSMGFSPGDMQQLVKGNTAITGAAAQVNGAAISDALKKTNNIFDAILYASLKTRLVNDYLVKTDRASMFTSLELRTPFLDRPLLDFVSSLPADYLIHKGVNKYITKKIAEKHFSREFIYRPKMGFSLPIGQWMRKEWKEHIAQVIHHENPYVALDLPYISRIWREHQDGTRDHTHRIWILYVLNRWADRNQKKN
ncbi:MAG: asparagine synthase (glutamine-hydrolyzing) [Bacteroidetes bacterium]|nr:asparagine synthase (glutamine-hydrolyzing) [Bacteroidota bacterium]